MLVLRKLGTDWVPHCCFHLYYGFLHPGSVALFYPPACFSSQESPSKPAVSSAPMPTIVRPGSLPLHFGYDPLHPTMPSPTSVITQAPPSSRTLGWVHSSLTLFNSISFWMLAWCDYGHYETFNLSSCCGFQDCFVREYVRQNNNTFHMLDLCLIRLRPYETCSYPSIILFHHFFHSVKRSQQLKRSNTCPH